MADDGIVKSSQLRHALRTPLNQISGYSDMLIEDLVCEALNPARLALDDIRSNGRRILDLVQRELPSDQPNITPEHLRFLREQIREPLEVITDRVGRMVTDGTARQAGLNLADVLRIGSAVAELVEFASGTRAMPSAVEPASVGTSVAATFTSGDVLVVDDNPGNRDLLERLLNRQGLRVQTAMDGEAALEAIARRRFDLILLDLMMPGMDGITALDRIKSDPQSRGIPVIMLSAIDETSRVIQCLESGAEDYVVKPFDPVLLLARLRYTLERSRLRVAETMRARELELAYEKLRENEQSLQESEERLRLATEAAEVGIWYYYAKQNHVQMTSGCKHLFGLPEDDEPLTFEQKLQSVLPEDRDRVAAETRRAIENESEYDCEFRVVWPNDAVHWLSSRGLAQCHGPAREMRLAGVVLDITQRKQAEEAVIEAHKLESIGLLAGGIAHDFNNLLTGIIGSASFVMDNLPEDDPNADMLRNVINAGERAADLTRQLLAYSGKGKFTVQKVDLSKLVSEIAVLLRASISRSVTLDRHLGEHLPRIEADSSQINQIIMNLVINGSEAISGEGVVRVSTELAALGKGGREAFVVGEEIPPGKYVCLEVNDTGSGMTREVLSKIFEPFFTTKFTGRGLGLAAVFGIVRGHDGGLEVRSTPGVGSTFRVYFPPVPGEEAGKNRLPSKILFVDDEAVVLMMGSTALERAGYQVFRARTGAEAIRILQGHRDEISLVILDVAMPGLNGFETYHRMKSENPDVRVVISTGFCEEDVLARYPGEKIDGLLQKPYSASALVAQVKELVQQL